MSTWRALWRLLTYQPSLYMLNLFLWGSFWTIPLLTGLMTRAIFDAITRGAQARLGLWSLLALLLSVAATRIIVNLFGVSAWATYYFGQAGLLRRNLLERILNRPGGQLRPLFLNHSPGVDPYR